MPLNKVTKKLVIFVNSFLSVHQLFFVKKKKEISLFIECTHKEGCRMDQPKHINKNNINDDFSNLNIPWKDESLSFNYFWNNNSIFQNFFSAIKRQNFLFNKNIIS